MSTIRPRSPIGRVGRRRALAAVIPLLAALAVASAPPARAEEAPDFTPSSSSSTTSATVPACPAPTSTGSVIPTVDPSPPVPDSLSTTALRGWGTAKADGKSRAQKVNAVVEAGGNAYLGGEFTKMVSGSSTSYRKYLAAIDGTTGRLKSWNPKASGKVWAMEVSADGKSVYVGGDFSYVGGWSVSKVAKIHLATGKPDKTFRPKSVKGRVRALALDGDRLYVGGEFKTIAGQSRPKLAALDARTGALLDWTPPPLGRGRYLGQTGVPTPDYEAGHVFAVEAFGGKVFAGGTFLDLGCQAALVTLDAATGGLAEPQYDPGRPVFGLDSAGGILYAVSGGPGGRVYAFGPEKERAIWRAKFDGDAVGVAVSASTVYVAGHFDYIVSEGSSCYQYCPGGPGRRHLAAFSAADGLLLPWNPTADTSTGPFTVAVGAKGLYVGGEFNKINGKTQPGFAIFPGTP